MRALASIRDQGEIPIVLVDDGSRLCACHSLEPDYPGLVRVARPHSGQGAALNAGILLVRTPFVTFLDSDDEWLPGKVKRQEELLRSENLDAVVGGVWNVTEVDGVVTDRRYFSSARLLGAITARTDSLRRVGWFPEDSRLHAIIDWWSRAEAAGLRIGTDPEPALMRRIHGRNGGIIHRSQARSDLLARIRSHRERGSTP
jgi:glycosyltransferase involved in cell wall biosynthesis